MYNTLYDHDQDTTRTLLLSKIFSCHQNDINVLFSAWYINYRESFSKLIIFTEYVHCVISQKCLVLEKIYFVVYKTKLLTTTKNIFFGYQNFFLVKPLYV